ncbi:hypothetical protein SFC65_19130 [Priestia filamentosa]
MKVRIDQETHIIYCQNEKVENIEKMVKMLLSFNKEADDKGDI